MFEIKIPRENANDDQVLVTKITKQSGSHVNIGDTIIEFETSKALIELEASVEGILELYIDAQQVVKVDEVIGTIRSGDVSMVEEHDPSYSTPSQKDSRDETALPKHQYISKKARKNFTTEELGSRTEYWITAGTGTKNSKSHYSHTDSIETKPRRDTLNSSCFEKISTRKTIEISALRESSTYLNSSISVEISGKRVNASNDFFNGLILDLLAYETRLLLLHEFADLNKSVYDDESYIIHDKIIPGIALDLENNLTVVSLTNVNSLIDFQDQIIDAVDRFSRNKLSASDLQRTTFTITDLSSTQAKFVLPLINQGQTFILAVTRHPTGFEVFGTFDHKVTEGKRFTTFLQSIKQRIELHLSPPEAIECSECLRNLSELDRLGIKGLIKMYNNNGEVLVCRNCLDGW